MVAKTVYDTDWKPSPITALVLLVMAIAITYVPYYLKSPTYIHPVAATLCQVSFAILVTMFFYSGISLAKQFKVAMLMLFTVSLFGLISNVFYQATYFVSGKLLTTDYVIVALMNLGGLALTLSCYRISQKKVEISAADEARALQPEKLKRLAPLIYALPVIASITCISFAHNLPRGDNFPINLAFYIALQLFISLWSGHFFFKEKSRAEKNRIGLSILSITMLLGTIGNLMYHVTMFKPGMRISLNSNEFLITNTGAVVIVLVFMHWNKKIAEQQAQKDKLLAGSPESAGIQSGPTLPAEADTAAEPLITVEASTKANQPQT